VALQLEAVINAKSYLLTGPDVINERVEMIEIYRQIMKPEQDSETYR
jgi:hypothetical protein